MRIDYLSKNIILGFILLIIISIAIFNLRLPLIWLLVLLMPLGLILRLVMKRTSNFVSGQLGEKDIDQELKSLGSGFDCYLGGFDTHKGNIDKVVIGPTGVWTMEVKNHNGEITFNGQSILRDNQSFEKDFLKQAYAESKTLQDFINSKLGHSIQVNPVLVFSNKYAKVRLGLNKYMGVYVIQKAWLKKLLTNSDSARISEGLRSEINDLLKTNNAI